MKVLGQAEPLTVTDRPLDRASEMREVFGLEGCSSMGGSGSERPREDRGGSVGESMIEERMKVADTEVISRTERWSMVVVVVVVRVHVLDHGSDLHYYISTVTRTT